MNKEKNPFFWLVAVIVLFSSMLLLPFFGMIGLGIAKSPTEAKIQKEMVKDEKKGEKIAFNLKDPEQAPENIRATVMHGYNIMINTPKFAAEYVGDELSCTNCHFAGGNTTGGKCGSIPLAGIAAVYPDYNERSKSVVTLPERINGCFKRSMNGKPMPLNSPEMDCMITYLHWISSGFPIYDPLPWRGLKPLEIRGSYTPDPDNGEKIYVAKCALCHGADGQGGIRIPPLWGDNSFNDGAGMYQLDTLAAFVHANMPYEEPQLSEKEAYDVAAFVRKQPRPKYKGDE